MDRAQRHPLEQDALTFREDTGREMRPGGGGAFAALSEEPVASASMAQVYRARLHDGRDVAVKIQQRPVARFLQARASPVHSHCRTIERSNERPAAPGGPAHD